MLIRFRKSAVAIIYDIAEKYLRIGIAKEDKPYHRFLWRGNNSNQPPDLYEFDRVVFGWIRHLPGTIRVTTACQEIPESFSDSGGNHFEIYLHGRFHELFAARRPGDQTDIPPAEKGWYACAYIVVKLVKDSSRDSCRRSEGRGRSRSRPVTVNKTLGVWWLVSQDMFVFKEKAPDEKMLYTKRNYLRKKATVFDPIGLLAPLRSEQRYYCRKCGRRV